MKNKVVNLVFIFLLSGVLLVHAQVTSSDPPPVKPTPTPTPKLSELFAKNIEQTAEVSREKREQAYAKLLEGQRYIWSMNRLRSQFGTATGARLAKQALQKAVELDPTLAEGYTALAELTLTTPPGDVEEAILLANIAIKLDKNNFGGQRILARLYTYKSNLSSESTKLNPEFTQKAIAAWKDIARLDPRNAEAWAFLSEFYHQLNQPNERIETLKKWLSSATPIETQFYRRVMGNQEDLSPENASIKLGSTLIKVGRIQEAIEILSQAVADEPQNTEAIELLREAIESADNDSATHALEALQQASYSNPENTALATVIAQIQLRSGSVESAARGLKNAIKRISEKDKSAAANLQVSLGEIYSEAEKYDEAVAAFQNALYLQEIGEGELKTDADRDFAAEVFEKMIRVYKTANRINDAKLLIEKSRTLFGKNDLFADNQLISLYRETGKHGEALQIVRELRGRFPQDYSLLRQEALILTENGKVDEGVELIKTLINKKAITPSANSIMYDDFSNYLFISMLYSNSKRGKEAIDTAHQAYLAAQSDDRKQIARLSLATAQQMSGDFKAAETTLRQILKESPNNAIALNNLGYFLLERNEKINEALDLIQKAVKIDPNNSSFLDSLGWAYFKLGKYEEAEKYLKDALRIDSSSSTILEHLGDVYEKRSKFDLAKNAWQKALNITTDVESISRLRTKLNMKPLK